MKQSLLVLKISIITLLVAPPILYIYLKSYNVAPLPNENSKVVESIKQMDVSSLENAVKTKPTFDNLVNLATAYINTKAPGKSIDYLKRAMDINPKSAIVYNDFGVAYTLLQQYQNGIDACSKALTLDSSFQLAKNNLKWATDEKNKVLAIIRTQEQTPTTLRNARFYNDLGLNYFKIGNYDKSIELWNKVFDIDPKNTEAINSIGIVFMEKHQYDDAIALFKKASEMEPSNSISKNNLTWAMEEKSKAEVLIKK